MSAANEMSLAEFHAMGRRGHKYGAQPVVLDDIRFDSTAEAERYGVLTVAQQAGVIASLMVHPRYLLQDAYRVGGIARRAIWYEADFFYLEEGRKIVEDVKGVQTAIWKIKQKLFEAKYPGYELCVINSGRDARL